MAQAASISADGTALSALILGMDGRDCPTGDDIMSGPFVVIGVLMAILFSLGESPSAPPQQKGGAIAFSMR